MEFCEYPTVAIILIVMETDGYLKRACLWCRKGAFFYKACLYLAEARCRPKGIYAVSPVRISREGRRMPKRTSLTVVPSLNVPVRLVRGKRRNVVP